MSRFHLHLVSDSTGDTVHSVARACLSQFEDSDAVEHIWSMVRSKAQVERVVAGIATHPGIVLFSIVNDALRQPLIEGCRKHQVPAIPVLDPVLGALAAFLGRQARGLPGQQHMLDHEYFQRIDAMTYALNHDDGQSLWGLNDADVVLVGVSRCSKTPTCIYLANRGIKAANIPLVPGVDAPAELFALTRPLIVGLTNDPDRLIQVRTQRLSSLHSDEDSEYTDLAKVRAEVTQARRLFTEHSWPVIDVSRRSIEETSAAILKLLARKQGQENA